MVRTDFLRSSSFRLAMGYWLLFGLSVLLLLGFIYWSTAGFMARQTEQAIEADIELLAERYRTGGLTGLSRLIAARVQEDPARSNLYLLIDGRGRRVVGNLGDWPATESDEGGWMEFRLFYDDAGEESHRARARSFQLRGGFRLLVGRDMHELDAVRALIAETLAWGLGLMLLLGLGVGFVMSRGITRRLDSINVTSREIMSGDLARRIPLRGTQDEFDQLTRNLNAMLERIQSLMDDVRRVSDSIAHDLKTPLTRLRNELESLRDTASTDSALQTKAEGALQEADSLLATFNALLRIARIESGQRREGMGDLTLAPLLRDVVEFYEPLAEQREIRLQMELDSDANIYGDRDLLFQAFANLMDNAIKYSGRGGHVHLRLHTADGTALIRIVDSGPGIPEAQQPQVFQRFYRGERSRHAPGSGLGLALVAAVVKLHAGDIALRNLHPGLEVNVRLPEHPRTALPPPP